MQLLLLVFHVSTMVVSSILRRVVICAAVFVASVAGSESAVGQWLDTFTSTDSLNGRVFSLAIGEDGDLFAGGQFTLAGGREVNHVARWDGTEWHALGSGTDGEVFAIEIDGQSVYVGGRFSTAGGLAANGIARWSDGAWHSFGSGLSADDLDPIVYAIAVVDSGFAVGGDFDASAGKETRGVAFWNGLEFVPIGGGVDGFFPTQRRDNVFALAVLDDVLVAAGDFHVTYDTLGALPDSISYTAAWDGKHWTRLSNGFAFDPRGPSVETLAMAGDTLVLGGDFRAPNGDSLLVGFFERRWVSIGGGITRGGTVSSLDVVAGQIVVAGDFTEVGNTLVSDIAVWTGSEWNGLKNGLQGHLGRAPAVASSGEDLYVGLSAAAAVTGEISSRYLAHWFSTPAAVSPTDNVSNGAAVYPNPFVDKVVVVLPRVGGDCSVSMYDLVGRQVVSPRTCQTNETVIEVGSLTSGAYVIVVTSQELSEVMLALKVSN